MNEWTCFPACCGGEESRRSSAVSFSEVSRKSTMNLNCRKVRIRKRIRTNFISDELKDAKKEKTKNEVKEKEEKEDEKQQSPLMLLPIDFLARLVFPNFSVKERCSMMRISQDWKRTILISFEITKELTTQSEFDFEQYQDEHLLKTIELHCPRLRLLNFTMENECLPSLIPTLKNCKNLEVLRVAITKYPTKRLIDASGILNLIGDVLPNIRVLALTNWSSNGDWMIGGKDLTLLARKCPNIELLYLDAHFHEPAEKDVRNVLTTCKKMRVFGLYGLFYSQLSIVDVFNGNLRLPHLLYLTLMFCGIDDEACAVIARACQFLKEMELGCNPLGDNGLLEFTHFCVQLESLDLFDTHITKKSIDLLSSKNILPSLQRLNIGRCRFIKSDDIDRLVEQRPLHTVAQGDFPVHNWLKITCENASISLDF